MSNLFLFLVLSSVLGIDITKCSDFWTNYLTNASSITLTQNIDCSGMASSGFTGIGGQSRPFNGTFDGQSFVISNFKINSSSWIGLFGATKSPALIANVKIVNAEIIGTNRIGILIGSMMGGGTVMNVHVQGKVTSNSFAVGGLVGTGSGSIYSSSANVEITVDNPDCSSSSVGGLVGDFQGTIGGSWSSGIITSNGCYVGGLVGYYAVYPIYNSFSTANVIGTGKLNNWTGGLLGSCATCNLRGCYATGNVTGVNGVGGLVGYVVDGYSNGTILQSYSTGAVNGVTGTGGLIGYISNTPAISQTYSSGLVTGENEPAGGLIGGLFEGSNSGVNTSYWDVDTTQQKNSIAGTGKETSDMYKQATYVDWDFKDVWGINEGQSYPYLLPQ